MVNHAACEKNGNMDDADFLSNMQLDGRPHLSNMTAEAKVVNF